MENQVAKCAYVYIDNNSDEFSCRHSCYLTGRYCVFHDGDQTGKSADFYNAFEAYMSQVTKDDKFLGFDFRGFIFPRMDLSKRVFGKGCDFRKAEFRGDLSCRNTRFHGEADFHSARFFKIADFQSVNFDERAQFIGCVFSGRTTFSGSKFWKSAVFHGCKFNDFVSCRSCKFHDLAVIQSNMFNADADFGESVFYMGANFDKTDLMEEIVRSRIKAPGELLLPPVLLPAKHFEEQVFVLRADLAGYTAATGEDASLEREIAAFLASHKSELEQQPECKLVKLTGDGLFVFATSGMFLVSMAAKLGGEFHCLKLSHPCPISGFRFVFSYGTLTCTEQGDGRDYSGTAIIEADRIDQPMKDFLQRNKSASNQWCTEAFHAQMSGKHPNLYFEPLPPVALAKGFKSEGRLFQIRVS